MKVNSQSHTAQVQIQLYWGNLEALGHQSNLLSSCGERHGGQGIAGDLLEGAAGDGPLTPIPYSTSFLARVRLVLQVKKT